MSKRFHKDVERELAQRLEATIHVAKEHKIDVVDSVSVRYIIGSDYYGDNRDPEGDYTDLWPRIMRWVRKGNDR